MKKVIYTLVLMLFIVTAKAQQNGSGFGFRLGLTAHPTFGWIKSDGDTGSDSKIGFSYGIMGDFNFAEHYSFTTGLTVTTINGEIGSVASGIVNLNYRLQYIEVPLTLKLQTSSKGNVRGYGQFGLSNDFQISNKSDSQTKNTDALTLYRAGLIIGAGAEFDIDDHTCITGGLTFNNGFTNIGEFNGNKLKNSYIGLNIGIFF